MTYLDSFKIQARYNAWMNEHIFSLCDPLSDSERKRDAGAFFKSIHGTLNHILLGDRLWLSRFQGTQFIFESLDQELYADYEELKHERRLTDAQILRYIDSLLATDLDRTISFISKVKNQRHTFLLADCILHFFHHQTHHRGQITTLISQLGIDIGVTDMMWLPGLEKTHATQSPQPN